MKKILSVMLLLTASVALYAAETVYFTPAELSQYNGQGGKAAYVAIDGVVYDVTGVDAWKNGEHKGNKAGQDLTAAIAKSPHGKGVLNKRPVVGKLVKAFTLAELSRFDGKEGRPPYVAVDGLVYDQSETGAWKSGSHGGAQAGTDISAQITKSPHGKGVLTKRPVVGKLVAETAPAKEEVKKK